MLEIANPAGLHDYLGKSLGVSEWMTLDQDTINRFADATGDHQWIHVDVERAAKEMPNGKTIAHGFLTLSLLPRMLANIYKVTKTSRGLNYGSNRVRFTAMVPVGSRLRMQASVKRVENVEGGVRMTLDCTIELEGSTRPALVAEFLLMAFD